MKKPVQLLLPVMLVILAMPSLALVNPEATQLTVPSWMAEIHVVLDRSNRTAGFCKGVLIAPQWVLSAASCLHDPNRVLDDEQGEPDYIVKLGPNSDVVEVEEFFPSDDFSVGLFRIALPSEAATLPLTGKTTAQLVGQEAVIFGRQASLPVMHPWYNPEVSAPSALCQINGTDFAINGALCYLVTKTTGSNTLLRTRARIIDPLAANAPATAIDKSAKPDTTGYQLHLDFREKLSYPCHEDLGSPVLVPSGSGYEVVAIVTGVGMATGLPICGMSLVNKFTSIAGTRAFIEQTMAGYDFASSCPHAPEPKVFYGSGNTITLRWPAVRGADGYKVHYTSDHGHLPVTTVDVATRTTVQTVIAPGIEYLAAVTAYNSNCSSGLSDLVPVKVDDRNN